MHYILYRYKEKQTWSKKCKHLFTDLKLKIMCCQRYCSYCIFRTDRVETSDIPAGCKQVYSQPSSETFTQYSSLCCLSFFSQHNQWRPRHICRYIYTSCATTTEWVEIRCYSLGYFSAAISAVIDALAREHGRLFLKIDQARSARMASQTHPRLHARVRK